MPEGERMHAEDFAEIKDAVELERLMALEETENRDKPDPVHKEVLDAMRARLEELRREQQN